MTIAIFSSLFGIVLCYNNQNIDKMQGPRQIAQKCLGERFTVQRHADLQHEILHNQFMAFNLAITMAIVSLGLVNNPYKTEQAEEVLNTYMQFN